MSLSTPTDLRVLGVMAPFRAHFDMPATLERSAEEEAELSVKVQGLGNDSTAAVDGAKASSLFSRPFTRSGIGQVSPQHSYTHPR